MKPNCGVAAIIVTRNRLALLQQCIAAIRSQTRPPEEILVIDNASDDGTAEWLAGQPGLTVIRQANLGGAGGFYEGIRQAYERGHDWFWCMDDDTLPTPTALAALAASREFCDPQTGFLSSLVQWKDGALHLMNLPMISAYSIWIGGVLETRTIPVLSSSLVSLLVSRRAVRECGLPLREMFIWSDDAEFTRRISRRMPCHVCLESVVLHATSENATDSLSQLDEKTLWKFRHGYRNSAFLLATGEGSRLYRAREFLRRGWQTARSLFALNKQAYLPALLAALGRGFFLFRPAIEFPPERSAGPDPGKAAP